MGPKLTTKRCALAGVYFSVCSVFYLLGRGGGDGGEQGNAGIAESGQDTCRAEVGFTPWRPN